MIKKLFIIQNCFEQMKGQLLDFLHAFDHFKDEIEEIFNGENLLVLYVCGGDIFVDNHCYLRE